MNRPEYWDCAEKWHAYWEWEKTQPVMDEKELRVDAKEMHESIKFHNRVWKAITASFLKNTAHLKLPG